ncbi:MAG TPA: hypothetical protein VIL86_16515 [Tepidisphaeraceae bacterium]
MNMPDPKPSRRLSEISHLFLSSVRQRQTGGQQRPRRTPPGGVPRPAVSIDLTPEEFAKRFNAPQAAEQLQATPPEVPIPPVTAILGAHLNGKQFDRVKQYARHLADAGQRIGLIEVDASELRLMCFEHGEPAEPSQPLESADARSIADAIQEMNYDVDAWLLLAPNPRVPEARELLRRVSHWVLLSTCDHDGVVSCYRTLKGVAESIVSTDGSAIERPRLSLALLDANDDTHAAGVYRKLESVCRQFLEWPLESESPVQPAPDVAEHLVLCCRPATDKAQSSLSPQWKGIGEFLEKAKRSNPPLSAHTDASAASSPADAEDAHPLEAQEEEIMAGSSENQAPSAAQQLPPIPAPAPRPTPMRDNAKPDQEVPMPKPQASIPTPNMTIQPRAQRIDDVLDLPNQLADSASILDAILNHAAGAIIQCPPAMSPPMCPDARLAIDRDRRMVLLAVAREGLSDLRAIGQGYRWLTENRALIAMALPQFALDASVTPQLRLLVDQSDISAEILRPMLESGHVTVESYRTLRWGGKTGLLLDAA